MDNLYEVYLELGFIERLKKADKWFRAEVLYFRFLIESRGLSVTNVAGYSMSPVSYYDRRPCDRLVISLKLMGEWTRLWLAFPEPNVVVLCDR